MATPVSSGMFGKHNYPLCHLSPQSPGGTLLRRRSGLCEGHKSHNVSHGVPCFGTPGTFHLCMGTFERPTRVVDPPEPLTTCEANGVFADRDLRSSQTSLLSPLTAHHENLGHMIVS